MSNNLTVKQKFYKKGLFDIDNDLYHLYCDLSHERCVGHLSRLDIIEFVQETIAAINEKVQDLERL